MMQEIYEKQKILFKLSDKDVIFFAEMAIDRNYKIFTASTKEDIEEFWDVGIENNYEETRVQVKGFIDCHKHNYATIELTSTQKDKLGRNIPGWLYGKANVLALRFHDSFKLYNMDELRKFIEEKVDFSSPIIQGNYYLENGGVDYERIKYRRRDRRGDITVAVPIEDIEYLKITEWR